MRIAIAGYGQEGKSAEKYWKDKGADVVVYDDGLDAYPNISDISGVDLIVRSPSVRPDSLPEDTEVTSVTQEFFNECPAQIIGITGTKGKGTTSTLITEFLKTAGKNVHLLGNIGEPALEELEDIRSDDIVVYEVSSFQLWDLHKSPHIAVMLMMQPDHMDVHKDMEEYIQAKSNIAAHQTPEDIVFYHPINELSADVASKGEGRKQKFMVESAAHVNGGDIYLKDQKICAVNEVTLVGKHNLENICAAISAASEFTDDIDAMKTVLTSFTGLEHRLQVIEEIDGVKYIDDSISTIPSTSIAAINAFENPIILIAGGSDKGLSYQALIDEIIAKDLKKVITIGETGIKIKEMLESAGYDRFEQADSMESVIEIAKSSSSEGDIVLLSPGSASFGMFENYKDRAKKFKQAVKGE